jgi:hypothetical protein
LQDINQFVVGALIVELLGQVRIHLEVYTPLLDLRNNLIGRASEQEQRDVVLRQRLLRRGRGQTEPAGHYQQGGSHHHFHSQI